ncbi:MAG: hypothetical protein V4721_01730 [Bacteroidota bacterium]
MSRNLILIALLAAFTIGCESSSERNVGTNSQNNDELLANISYDSSGYTADALSFGAADTMVRNYKPHAGKDSEDSGKQNTRSVWFHLDTLGKLVDQLRAERTALQKGDSTKTDSVTDGVRIYFGRYQNVSGRKERNTLIFVSTFWVKSEKGHKDYYHKIPKKRTEPLNNGELSPPNNFGVSFGSEVD